MKLADITHVLCTKRAQDLKLLQGYGSVQAQWHSITWQRKRFQNSCQAHDTD